jgi:hypothetical protein
MILVDFRCQKGHAFEELVNSTDRTMPCPKCGRKADRTILPAPFSARAKNPGIQDSEPSWLPGATSLVQDPLDVRDKQEAPITSRSDFERHMRRKGLHLVAGREI